MGKIVIAAFKPRAGKEDEFREVMADRLPLLRRLGLATQRDNITMRAANGTILDVSEWTDDEAIARAHQSPEVIELWKRYDACCEYVKLETIDEIHEDFATFQSVTL